MKSFNLEKNGVNRGGIIGCNIVMMRKKIFGIVGPIKCAPSRYQLKQFGGPLTIEEFRSYGTKDMGVPDRLENEEPQTKHIVTMSKQNVISTNFTKLSQISESSGTNEPLRLKRPKPLKRDENNLEKSLGITRKKVPTADSATKP